MQHLLFAFFHSGTTCSDGLTAKSTHSEETQRSLFGARRYFTPSPHFPRSLLFSHFLLQPTYIETKRGTKLLTSGFWGVARHLNYTGMSGGILERDGR
jgi:hypothetical protein